MFPVRRGSVAAGPSWRSCRSCVSDGLSMLFFCFGHEKDSRERFFFVSSRRRHTRCLSDWSSDVCSSDLAKEAGSDRLVVVRRRLPNAWQGKGPALNAGFARICREVTDAGFAPERVLILVMDADGRMSDDAVVKVKPLFA